MKKVIIVDVSINNKQNTKSLVRKIKSCIDQSGHNYDLYCFDVFSYRLDDIDDFVDEDFEYNKPCAYYDCLMEIMRQYIGRNKEKAVFYIISKHIDDCSRLADEEIYERYIHHIESNYDATIHMTDSDEIEDEYAPNLIESLINKFKYEIRYPWIRYSEDFDDEYEDNIVDYPPYLRTN